jgi:hypothetical protein
VTLAIIDEKWFLTVFQMVLPLHECVDPTAAEPLHSVFDSTAETLQYVADSTATAPTDTS